MKLIQIGNLTLKTPVIQAPMCGCTDLPFRTIAREFGCELAFPDMVKDVAVLQKKNKRTKKIIETAEGDRPLGIQLAGREPEIISEAAKKLEAHGADILDINLGCPVRKVVNSGCGAALLKEPEQVGRIVKAMVGAVNVPVTIKMRTGFENEEEGTYLKIAKIAESEGAQAVTLHGRSRLQRFSGVSNHDAIRKLKQTVSIPVIGNGNIYTAEDAAKMMQETGCDGVMVARGSLGNPWIYRDIISYFETGTVPPRPTTLERIDVLRRQVLHMAEFYGPRGFNIARRVLHWFIKGNPGCAQLRLKANDVNSLETFEVLLKAFEESAADQPAVA
jgi:nifR3 family TIM-barrel protein